VPEVEPSWSLNPCGEVVDLGYPCGGQFPIWLIKLALDLVLDARVSLRAVPRVLQLLGRLVGQVLVVDWSTVRSWLLRLGCFALRSPFEPAEDVAYLVDFSIQLGTCKCLVIVAVREVPYPERCLRYVDLQIIAVMPLEKATGVVIQQELDKAAARTGRPRLIVSDQGSDVKKGIEDFCQAHPETAATHDMAHKGARLLQHRLEADQRWPEFLRRLGQTKVGVQQTDQAHLMPPSVRPKARYMNLGPVLRWARRLLQLLDAAPTAKVNREKLEAKYGWLREYGSAIAEWSELHEVTQQATVFVRREGYYQSADADLVDHLNGLCLGAAAQTLVAEVVAFVAQQSAQARPGERLIGSTEVLESLFGRQKELERQQSKGGFTGLILGLGAQLCDRTAAGVKAALEATPVKVVSDWIGTHLGQSLQSQRQEAFASLGVTKPG
jgi:hypothetical protein